MASYEMKNRVEVGHCPSQDRDDLDLARIGKRAVLKRNFSTLSILAFSCTITSTWEGILNTFLLPMTNGGPAGAVYEYIFAWIGTASCFLVLAELSSMAPTSGGQYHWCAMLAPPSCMKFYSYITGWITVFAWQTAFASIALLSGTEIQGAAILTFKNYQSEHYHGTLILWACVILALAVNATGGKLLPRLENLVFVLHIVGFLAILITLTSVADHKSAKEVFTTWTNSGGWSSNGIVFFIGMQGSVFAFSGGDAAVHMAEEVHKASVVIPRALILTALINGALGFGMLIGVLFCMGDLEAATKSPTGYPYMEIFFQATNSLGGTVAMICIALVICICSAIGMIAATSRQFWSFARDRGVPGWRVWSKVSPTTNIPIYSVCFTMVVSCLLGLINIGSDVALKDILSMAVSGLYLSYLTVGTLLLYRRLRGHIRTSSECEDMTVNVPNASLVWGPFRIPGVLGVVNNIFAVCYMIIVIFFSFWPTTVVVDYKSMNYSVVGTFGTVIIAVVYYVVRARHVYHGPVVEGV
ncbi:amino acid/polyamine transporter I [Aspergillus pseudonomiae]|uniref:Amino acid/polyamine transporter I n=1 Tax=Aspergillus pseudonomiae TaxID=1506151 RepID=A0A5N6IG88_9EURO|nr:amino acid/polyamine transporter I [Aspergillus pseudonomiae]KAB8264830.1 amino acid/polyamine transporter I [Aspergillus pseudonomiae]KAE8407514.1 amino acid/polyamine transporter I [Aspergillus pseudonomiae]